MLVSLYMYIKTVIKTYMYPPQSYEVPVLVERASPSDSFSLSSGRYNYNEYY